VRTVCIHQALLLAACMPAIVCCVNAVYIISNALSDLAFSAICPFQLKMQPLKVSVTSIGTVAFVQMHRSSAMVTCDVMTGMIDGMHASNT
jgi:hypothetical protein